MDIHAFLTARYDEDDAGARHAFADHNDSGPHWTEVTTGAVDTGGTGLDSIIVTGDGPMARHIADWDPARVLAETAAKRKLLEAGGPYCDMYCDDPDNQPVWDFPLVHYIGCSADQAAKLLATVYSDHPDYRKDWNTQ
jgi:hypothetical protein